MAKIDVMIVDEAHLVPELKPFEVWAAEKKTPDWLLAATKASQDWPGGREMTEAAFDAGVQRGANLQMLPS